MDLTYFVYSRSPKMRAYMTYSAPREHIADVLTVTVPATPGSST